jgi:hypothetical protein
MENELPKTVDLDEEKKKSDEIDAENKTEVNSSAVVKRRMFSISDQGLYLIVRDRVTDRVRFGSRDDKLLITQTEDEEFFLFAHFALQKPLDAESLSLVEMEVSTQVPSNDKSEVQLGYNLVPWSLNAFASFKMLPNLEVVEKFLINLKTSSLDQNVQSRLFYHNRIDVTAFIKGLINKLDQDPYSFSLFFRTTDPKTKIFFMKEKGIRLRFYQN